MLPQKSGNKVFSRPMDSSLEQDSLKHGAGEQASVASQPSQTEVATMLPPSRLMPYATMRPPVDLGRTDSKRGSSTTGNLSRLPSTSRKSSREICTNEAYPIKTPRELPQPRPQVRMSSVGSDPQSKTKESHGRSSSQQVRPTAASNLLSSKVFPQNKPSIKHPRPAFSPMQQRFSPKKNIQPDPSTLTSQSKVEIPSADTFQMQLELAQLHLLHRSVISVQVQWEKSAKESTEQRFRALYERHTELKEVAHQQQTLINQLALIQWAHGRSGAQISERVQLLSHNVSEIRNLLDSEGKYTRILEVFGAWLAQALRVRDRRESKAQNIGGDFDFTEGIGDGWKAEAMVLERELTYSARDLESFGEVQSSSNMCRMLSMYRKLTVGLLEELDLIQCIENEIMTQDTSWIESTIHNFASNLSEDLGSVGSDRKAV